MIVSNLFNRIIISLLIMLVTVMGISGYTLISNLTEKTTASYLDESRHYAELVRHSLSQWIEEQRSLTRNLARQEPFIAALEHPRDEALYYRAQQQLQSLYEEMGYYENATLFIRLDDSTTLDLHRYGQNARITNGTIFLDTVGGRTLGKGGPKLDYVEHAMNRGETYISDPYPSLLRGNPIFVIATPVRNVRGEILGIIATAPVLERFGDKFISGITMGTHGHLMVCDNHGVIIAHPERKRLLNQNIFDTLDITEFPGNYGTIEREIEGETVWYTYEKEPLTGWYVIGKIYESDIYDAFTREITVTLVTLLIMSLLLGFGGWLLIRREVIRPLGNLMEMLRNFSPTKRITEEDLHKNSSTEFKQIHESMLKMSELFHTYLREQEKMQAEIRRHAMYDQLTDLPNRRYLSNYIEEQLVRAEHESRRLGIYFLDLDHFKLINDSLGHDIGDKLLKETAHRLTELLEPTDMIARLGGDEFIIVCGSEQTVDAYKALAARIVKVMHDKLVIENQENHEFIISTSVGLSVYPEHGQDIKTLMKHADIALYRAKEDGRNGYCIFDEGMNESIRNQLYLEQDMRAGLDKGEYTLYYQPQIDARSGQVVGAEALIRWIHPELGIISPIRFIDLAESTGFIYDLGDWILIEACSTLSKWQKEFPEFKLSINISARQFQEAGFVDKVAKAMEDFDIRPSSLVFEITETLLMAQKEHSRQVLEDLKKLDILIAMDDFGTGYSSLAYLKNFPIDIIKIDKSFIQGIFDNNDDFNIVKAVITLGNELDLTVIAEGVETMYQLDFLKTSHCHIIQGYFFSMPLPSFEFIQYMKTQG